MSLSLLSKKSKKSLPSERVPEFRKKKTTTAAAVIIRHIGASQAVEESNGMA